MTPLHARRVGLWAAVATLASLAPPAGAVPPGTTVTAVHGGLDFPVGFRFAPDGRLFYIELTGRVMVFDDDSDPTPSVWATVPTDATGDRGLLGIALHPAFPDSPFVYLYHANPSPLVDRVVRLRDQGGVGTGYTILRGDIPATATVHHGGRLAFAPDGTLWLTYGDQGSSAAAQDPANIRGKLLRFTSMGQNAPGNFSGPWMVSGVRNSFGICFDLATGNGYFTDNGPTCDDELNWIVAGDNYGWGPSDACNGQPAGTRLGIATFNPVFAPTSCVVYHGVAAPALDGQLFLGGYVDGSLRRVVFRPGSHGTEVDSIEVYHQIEGANVLDVIVGNDGKLWFSTAGTIYRIDPPAATDVDPTPPGARRLRVSPNPSGASVSFLLEPAGLDATVEILDLTGRSVRRLSASGAEARWDGRDRHGRVAAPGLYLVRVAWSGGATHGRLVRIGR